MALETHELATLLVRMEQAVNETGGRFKTQGILVVGLFVLMGLGMGVQGSWGIAAFVWGFGVLLTFVFLKAASKNSPEKMQPVVDAMRDAPETIKLVRHYETSDSARMFVTQWLSIATEKNQLLLKATADWKQLLTYIKERCPDAKYLDK